MVSKKEIILTPSHATLFWRHTISILLMPIFGIGLFFLYRNYKTINSIKYIIRDESIEIIDSKYSSTVDLVNITDITVYERLIDKLFKIGDVQLKTNSREIRLIGLKNPDNLANMIMTAAEMQRKRQTEISPNRPVEKKYHPGSLDKLDYLTGLWQQGLMSNEDFLEEKKNFD